MARRAIVPRVPMSVALAVARLSRRGLCAAVALALSLTCIGLAVSASTTPMAGMVDMAGTSATGASMSAPAVTEGAFIGGQTGVAISAAVSPVASVMPPMSSMCDSACVINASAVCTIAGGLMVTSVLALLLASRRGTFLGLLARTRPRALRRRRRRHTPWTVLSPMSLCVLRE